jgi:pyruvate formate lyase activating enzyme
MGIVFNIQRFSVQDGPGIRTTVFLKGCPLSCCWCHNPEGIDPKPQGMVRKETLRGRVFEEKEEVGKEMEVEEVLSFLHRERVVMEESGGGVTFSGGEPLMQPDFLRELLKAATNEGFHTAVDTSGFAPAEHLEQILPFTNLFLYDLKGMDDRIHKQYTGVSNRVILENLKFLSKGGSRIRIRIPLLRGINNGEKNINETILFLKSLYQIEQIDLLPYHPAGKSKYQRLGIKYRMPEQETLTENEMEDIKRIFESAGFKVKIGGS